MKKLWWQATGKFERKFGTSQSTGWVSGVVALLKSAVPECSPREIKEALKASSQTLASAPDGPGMTRLDKAYAFLMQDAERYESAKRALYYNAGNAEAQRNSSYLREAVEVVLRFLQQHKIDQGRRVEAADELTNILNWLVPDALPDLVERINAMLDSCTNQEAPTACY